MRLFSYWSEMALFYMAVFFMVVFYIPKNNGAAKKSNP